jgi:hypothetical protein
LNFIDAWLRDSTKIHGWKTETKVRKGRWEKFIEMKGTDILFSAPHRGVLSQVGANVKT